MFQQAWIKWPVSYANTAKKDHFSKGKRLTELHTDNKSSLEIDTAVSTYNPNCYMNWDAPCPKSVTELWNKAWPGSGSGFVSLWLLESS